MFRVRSEARTFSHASFHFSCDLEIKHNPTIVKEIHVASPDETPKVDRRSSFVACLRRLIGQKVSGFYVNVFQRPCLTDQASHPTTQREPAPLSTELYFQGEQCGGRRRYVRGSSRRLPADKTGGRLLPRCWRPLKAWRRLSPCRWRRAMVLPVWAATCWR